MNPTLLWVVADASGLVGGVERLHQQVVQVEFEQVLSDQEAEGVLDVGRDSGWSGAAGSDDVFRVENKRSVRVILPISVRP